jgi:hypothetical protein
MQCVGGLGRKMVGLTIVTRDASLFENPVDPEFGNQY